MQQANAARDQLCKGTDSEEGRKWVAAAQKEASEARMETTAVQEASDYWDQAKISNMPVHAALHQRALEKKGFDMKKLYDELATKEAMLAEKEALIVEQEALITEKEALITEKEAEQIIQGTDPILCVWSLMNVLPMDRGRKAKEGCNSDKPLIGDESTLPTGR
eukprot:282141-Rhodomonas_salina.2